MTSPMYAGLAAMTLFLGGLASSDDDGPSTENAAPLYRQALARHELPDDEVRDEIEAVLLGGWTGDRPALVGHLEHNAEALALFERAASLPRAEFSERSDVHQAAFKKWLPIRELYSLTRTLLLEGRRAEGQGKFASALDRFLLVMRIGHHLGQDPGAAFIPKATEWALQDLALPHVQRLLHTALEAREWRRALKALGVLQRERIGLELAFENDQLAVQGLMEQALRSDLEDPAACLEAFRRIQAEFAACFLEAYREVRPELYDRRLRELEDETARSLTPVPLSGDSDQLRHFYEQAPDQVAKVLIQSSLPSGTVITAFYVHRARMDMLALVIATRVYSLERGELPQTPEDLVPDLLLEVPTDPFADGEPIRYYRRDHHWWYYSIGPDRVDQHGERRMAQGGLFGEGDILSLAESE